MQRAELKSEWTRQGYKSMKSFSKACEIPYYTFLDKWYGKTRFNIDDIRAMVNALHLQEQPDRIVSIFFGETVAK